MDARRSRTIIACALLLVAPRVRAAHAASAKMPGFDGYGYVSSYYDNNVFSYSDQDRQRFEAGDTTGKFPIDDLADIVTTLALRGDYRWHVDGRSMWRARLQYDGSFYARNTDKTNHDFGVSLDRFFKRSSIGLSADYVPDFYLRHLYWRPMPGRPAGVRYAAARYSKAGLQLQGRTRLARALDGVLNLGYARRNYDYPFDERDNSTFSMGAGVDATPMRRLSLSALLKYDATRASGADSTNPAADDISNNRYGAEVEGTWRFNDWVRFTQSVDYGHLVFTTNNQVDTSHFDRTDDKVESSSRLRFGSFSGWQPDLFFVYRWSRSSTPPGIAEFGQYDEVRWGVQVTYYL